MNIETVIKDLNDLDVHRHRRIWKPFMEKYDCQVIAELGVRSGQNFLEMIAHNPKEAVAVDCWIDDGVLARNDTLGTQDALDKQYLDFNKKVEDKLFVKINRGYTIEEVKHFEDNYFDLIYVDADHTYSACLRDIVDWYPKVKSGGFLLGDDYRPGYKTSSGIVFGVVEAVKEFAKNNNLKFYPISYHGWVIIKP